MPAAVAIPAIIGAAGTVGGSLIQRGAAGHAADIQSQNAEQVARMAQDAAASAGGGVTDAAAQAGAGVIQGTDRANAFISDSTANANNLLSNIFNLQTDALSPYFAAGQTGLTNLMDMLGTNGAFSDKFKAPTAEEVAATPGFQFQMQEAQKALERSAAARGGAMGGGAAKALARYSNDIASTYYQNAFKNSLDVFNTNRQGVLSRMAGLSNLAGMGTWATGQYNQAAGNYGDQASGNMFRSGVLQGTNLIDAARYAGSANLGAAEYAGNAKIHGVDTAANAYTGGANARAAGAVASGNAWNNMIGGLTNMGQWVAGQLWPTNGTPPPKANNNFATWYNSTYPALPPTFAPQPNMNVPGYTGLPGFMQPGTPGL